MAGKIFVSYRRDDVAGDARGIRDALAAKFGKSHVFMDVDNLLAGQRFDRKLDEALEACDVLIAVIGPRWMDLLAARTSGSERDFVRAEIAAALKRGIVVIPVRVGQEGRMPPLPRGGGLPEDIRDLVLHQKHDVAHERFGRDMADLMVAIQTVRRGERSAVPWGRIAAAGAVVALLGAAVFASQYPAVQTGAVARQEEEARAKDQAQAEAKRKADEAERRRLAKVEEERRAEAKRKADEAERQRLAMVKAVEDRRHAEADLLRPGRVFGDCPDVCPEMVVVPAGSFMMGSPPGEEGRLDSEDPQRKVTIAQPFAVGKFEVTFAEWDACVAAGGCGHRPGDSGWGRGKRPVINVFWDDITKEFLPWLSRKTGKSYRLLTEAEWEYAARAGTATPFSTGRTITTDQANFNGAKTVEVGSFQPNAFGLHAMHGNVWEWVQDCWNGNYSGAPSDGSAWATGDCSRRVLRGGSWSDNPRFLRSAYRFRNSSGTRYIYYGFRVGRTL